MINDLLDREDDIDRIMKIIDAKSTTVSFDIDGRWGVGKSFLLEMLKERIAELNKPDPKYLVLSYNCWKYDYYEEPLIAIVSSMISNLEQPTDNVLESFSNQAKKNIINIFKKIASTFMKNKIGVDLIEIYEDYKSNYQESKKKKYEFDYYQGFTQAINFVRKQISDLAKIYKIILIIDELDRCLPTYAIKVMERVHHLFEDIDHVTIIYSLDRNQIENTVKNLFGEQINSEDYLKKFIDFTMPLGTGDTMHYINFFPISLTSMIKDHFITFPMDEYEIKAIKFFSKLFSSVEVRNTKKIIQKIEIILGFILEEYHNLDYSLIGAIIIYMFYKKELNELMDALFSPYITTIPNRYVYVKDFLDIKIESNLGAPISFSYERFDHNIAWILYNSDESVKTRNHLTVRRVNSFKYLEIEINLFNKFKEYSDIIK